MDIYIEDEEILDLTPYMSNDFLKGDKGDKGDTYTITSSDYQAIANVVKTDIQSTLNNKVDKETGKGLSTNDFTDTYKNNVDSNTSARHTHSNKSILDDITSTDISNWNNKADTSDIPENTSDLTNDSGFITNAVDDLLNYYKKSESFTKQEVNDLISAITTMDLQVVQTLPTQDISTTTIYLVPKTTAETNNAYDEYIYVSNSWEFIGSTEVDLTDYVKNTDYANGTTGGVIKSGGYGVSVDANGRVYCSVLDYATYLNQGNAYFVGKGTLENVITGKELVNKTYVDGLVGDIDTVLETLTVGGGVS